MKILKRLLTLCLTMTVLLCNVFKVITDDGNQVYASSPYTFNSDSIELFSGGTFQLQISGLTPECVVTWGSLDTSVAIILNGLVTAVNPGITTVWGHVHDADSYHLLVAVVYVKIYNGIYSLKNDNSCMYLELYSQCILNGTDVVQMNLHGSVFPELYQISQYWKIKYLGTGYYIIRPYQRLDCALSKESGYAKINPCYSDTLSSVDAKMRWRIACTPGGSYILTNTISRTLYTMQIENNSTSFNAKCIAASSSGSTSTEWTLSKKDNPPEGVLLYDSATGLNFTDKNVDLAKRTVNYSLSDMGIVSCRYSETLTVSNVHNASWISTNTDIATINNAGSLFAREAGTSEMRAFFNSTASDYSKFTARVERLPNPDLQNKDHWCWAAAAKRVGVHNGGNTASNNPLPEGVMILGYYDGLHEYTPVGGGATIKCYGEQYNALKTADAGQHYIVYLIKGTDEDLSGSSSDTVAALQLASYNTMNIEKKEKVFLLGWTPSLINTFNNELDNGRYVYVSMEVISNSDTYYHAMVITDKINEDGTTKYALWNPASGRTVYVTQSELFSSNGISFNEMSLLLKVFYICN